MWYYIESSNKIVDLSPDWDQLAVGEGAPGPPRSEIIGCSLWDFVSGHETRSYLNALFFWCRQSNRAISLPYRCDGPGLLRECRMNITPRGEGLTVHHQLLLESRPVVRGLLEPLGPTTRCSQCLRWEQPDGWKDIVTAQGADELFLTYVVCPDCRAAANRALGRHGDTAGDDFEPSL